ncbi:peptidoglycan-binding protein [Epibacterium sp. SM1979]|uniref:Peptidoglycan-binding protein n=1 Tax=Tritonibacter litoralis TaxID=2662264 RepID=A0A843YIF0_9RHOB|nr:trypsin-like peptidase domain-containing protein [Tritonibacter litoralis]MQQ09445.1 peptidoglycan-binding protein [Tritonibacter litoralis]
MKKIIAVWALSILSLIIAAPRAVQAQQEPTVWIQIAAHPSLAQAEARARDFASRLPDVSGFSLGGGWYGVVLGPYSRTDAERVLQVYRAERQIPGDSFIAFSRNLRAQFYPVGPVETTPVIPPVAEAAPEPSQSPAVSSDFDDESPAEARRSEARLSRDEKMQLQIALQAQGFYNSSIDGSFGRGTRRSMADWQAANRVEPTGVLTTRQRQSLLDQYNAPLISVGMDRVEDAAAGIALSLPTQEVTFARHESPFSIYETSGDLGAQVLLISQPGDARTLAGLFEILQTLEIVPLEGPRSRQGNSFSIEGRGKGMITHAEATLRNGEIKGFALIWPTGDDERRARILTEMQRSFTRLDGVLDPTAGADAPQSVDLLSGLEIRKPRLSRTGFFVDATGTVLTTSDVVAECSQVTLDHDYPVDVILNDTPNGVAVLRPRGTLAPMDVAQLATSAPRLQSDVAVAGFSYEGVLGAPSLTWGTLSDLRSLDGNQGVARLALAAQSGDVGGPVLNTNGAVLGMLLPRQIGSQQLPDGVSFAANAQALRAILERASVAAVDQSDDQGQVPNAELVRKANGMTVLVSCWN